MIRALPVLLLLHALVQPATAHAGEPATKPAVRPAAKPAGGPAAKPAVEPAVELVTLTAQPAIARTVRAKPDALGMQITGAVLSLVATADRHQLAIVGPPFARYLSRGATLEVEVGVPIRKPPGKPLGKDLRAIELPAGRAAVVVFRGPHDQLPRAHAALDAWLAAHRERPSGPRWESYLTNPIETPDPAAQQTRVVAPLAN